MLTVEQLKVLEVGDWVWVEDTYSHRGYWKIGNIFPDDILFVCKGVTDVHPFNTYGDTWFVYKNKEEAEGKLLTPPCQVGDAVFAVNLATYSDGFKQWFINEGHCSMLQQKADRSWKVRVNYGYQSCYDEKGSSFGKTIFTDRKQAEKRLEELQAKE